MDGSPLPSGINTPKSLGTEGTFDGSAYQQFAGTRAEKGSPLEAGPPVSVLAATETLRQACTASRLRLNDGVIAAQPNPFFGQGGEVHRVDLRRDSKTFWHSFVLPLKTPAVIAAVLLLYMVYCTAAVAVLLYATSTSSWERYNTALQTVTLLTGVLLGLLLILRLHRSFDRWQAASSSWDSVALHCTTLARAAVVHLRDCSSAQRVISLADAFPSALKMQLTDDRKLLHFEAPLLSVEDRFDVLSSYNMPLHVLCLLSVTGSQPFAQLGLGWVYESSLTALATAVSTCSSMKAGTTPSSYVAHIRLLLGCWLAVLPFSLALLLDWYAIGPAAFLLFTFVGVEVVASQMDHPFHKHAGLPLDSIATHQQIGLYYSHVDGGQGRDGTAGGVGGTRADASSTVIEMAAILLHREAANRSQDGTVDAGETEEGSV